MNNTSANIQLGDTAPDFVQDSTEGVVNFHQAIEGHWAVLFSHPKNFTPVCTTELGEVALLKPEFDRRTVKVFGLSVDALPAHAQWAQDIAETQGHALNFPLIADADRSVSLRYGMIHPNADNTLTVRSVFIIDSNKRVRLTITYPASTGRSFAEILRVIDSLQRTDAYKVATPVNWHPGDDVIILPALQDEAEIQRLFPQGYHAPKPYLRITTDPGV